VPSSLSPSPITSPSATARPLVQPCSTSPALPPDWPSATERSSSCSEPRTSRSGWRDSTRERGPPCSAP
jgi:hypothetical protein